MDTAWIVAVSGFAVAMAATPGPNNTLVAAAGANHGFRGSLPLMSGIAFGVTAIILAVATLGASLLADPLVRDTLKWLGLVYLLWLAWKIGSARPVLPGAGNDSPGAPLSFLQGALFQFINPKLWVMVAGAIVTYGGSSGARPLAVAAVFGAIFGTTTFASVILWALIGVGAGRMLRTERRMRMFNGAMAALLVASLVPVLLNG